MKIAECMTRDVRIANPEQTIQAAARMMAECDTGALPVGQNDRLVGMVTDRDITIRAVAEGKGPGAKIGDVMTHDVCYCFEDEDVDHVLDAMGDSRVRRLPVLNRAKRLVGIVSLSDLAMKAGSAHIGQTVGKISQPGGEHSQAVH